MLIPCEPVYPLLENIFLLLLFTSTGIILFFIFLYEKQKQKRTKFELAAVGASAVAFLAYLRILFIAMSFPGDTRPADYSLTWLLFILSFLFMQISALKVVIKNYRQRTLGENEYCLILCLLVFWISYIVLLTLPRNCLF